MIRLTDNEKQFGPITYGHSGWCPWRIVLSSGDREEHLQHQNVLTCYAFGWVARIKLPNLIRPLSEQRKAGWDEATVKRMGRDWYEKTFPREYGFCLHEGFLQIFYGVQRMDGERSKSWCKHLPWTQKRMVQFEYLDLEGKTFWKQVGDLRGSDIFSAQRSAKETCPSAKFLLHDYDGTEITATVVLEDRIYRQGIGWFKWLGWLMRPEIIRRADISFSAETGPEKGSWKGGTTGSSFVVTTNMLHEQIMREYCNRDQRSKYRNYTMKFIGPVVAGEVA